MCAVLCEAGYPDPWQWTPREIVHRFTVHRKIHDQRQREHDLRSLEIAVLGHHGEQKHIKDFVKRRAGDDQGDRPHSEKPVTIAALSQKTISPALAKRLEEEERLLGLLEE